jgi:putative SOS response-associated peptidase YedK
VLSTRQKITRMKQQFAIGATDAPMIAFAGLWDARQDKAKGQWLQSYYIVTTEANELMSAVHSRSRSSFIGVT